MKDGSLYEIDIPPDRIAVPSDEIIRGEIGKTKRSKEEEAVRKYVRGDI
jgi:hypothetical protein